MYSGQHESFVGKISERRFRCSPEDRFERRVEVLKERADALSVRTHITVMRGNESLYRDETVVFGASLGKLPLAVMAIDMMYSDERWVIEPDIIDKTGGGVFDQEIHHEATTAELLDDMLRNSGNTAYRVLARGLGGPNQINEYYETKWISTQVDDDPDTGRSVLGETTPQESMMQLREILLGTSGDERLRQRALLALLNSSAADRGIRKYVKGSDDLAIYNKIGEYNGDEDDPLVFRHDVGFVRGEHGSISYAILTSSPMKMRGIVANMVVSQFGAEVAREVGGPNVVALGSRAMRLVL